MALYEYYCSSCEIKFEEITRSSDPHPGTCPRCSSAENTEKLLSAFKVGGRGDLRESTLHGCHDNGPVPSSAPDSHRCGGGCKH